MIEFKQFRVSPDFGTVMSNINRNITHDAYPVFMAMTLQRSPLSKEFKLGEFVEVDIVPQALACLSKSAGFTAGDRRLPSSPDRLFARSMFKGHEKGILLEPPRVATAKATEFAAVTIEPAISRPQGAP